MLIEKHTLRRAVENQNLLVTDFWRKSEADSWPKVTGRSQQLLTDLCGTGRWPWSARRDGCSQPENLCCLWHTITLLGDKNWRISDTKHPLDEQTGQRNIQGNVITLQQSCACCTCSLEKWKTIHTDLAI